VPDDAPFIGVVGRLVPIKDLGTFLDAAVLLRQQIPAARFALVGDGELRQELEARSAALGLSGCLHFYGWRRDMSEVYGDLDIVVNCSRNEGTPVALIEAMTAGRPVVATAVGGTPDLLGNGQRGVLVPASDPTALAGAIVESLRTPAPERVSAARRYVLTHHSVDRLLSDVDGLYRQMLAEATRA
jgi:glycosyltransferase involved in cell wall biosynthesis